MFCHQGCWTQSKNQTTIINIICIQLVGVGGGTGTQDIYTYIYIYICVYIYIIYIYIYVCLFCWVVARLMRISSILLQPKVMHTSIFLHCTSRRCSAHIKESTQTNKQTNQETKKPTVRTWNRQCIWLSLFFQVVGENCAMQSTHWSVQL